MAVLLSFLTEANDQKASALKNYYLRYFPDIKKHASPIKITSGVEKDLEETSEYINKIYLEQTQLQQDLSQMERQAKFYADLAFFMQILSLILILLRKDFLI
jgi:hypothetical protein